MEPVRLSSDTSVEFTDGTMVLGQGSEQVVLDFAELKTFKTVLDSALDEDGFIPTWIGFYNGQEVINKLHRHEEVMIFCCLYPGIDKYAIVLRGDRRLSEMPVKDLIPYIKE